MINKRFVITFIFSLILGIFTSAFMVTYKKNNSNSQISDIQQTMAEKILRFHVVANSNTPKDQELKLKVKKAVTDYLENVMKNCSDVKEATDIINLHNDKLISIASSVIAENGYSYTVTGKIAKNTYFPLKQYGDISLPPGNYCAYEIIIGDGSGANWWCILYPPLCFIDISTGVVPEASKEELNLILDEDEYSLITTGKPKNITVKFKYLTFLNRFL